VVFDCEVLSGFLGVVVACYFVDGLEVKGECV